MSLRRSQWLGALAVVACGALLWNQHLWPFDSNPKSIERYTHPSIWQYVLADRTTLGLVRIGILAFVAFIAVSVPALVMAGRWLKTFGAQSVAADTVDEAKGTIDQGKAVVEELRKTVEELEGQRDVALALTAEWEKRALQAHDRWVEACKERDEARVLLAAQEGS